MLEKVVNKTCGKLVASCLAAIAPINGWAQWQLETGFPTTKMTPMRSG